MAENAGQDPVLHVVVVGFHHKKGCQVEYSYPPLIEGNSVESHEIPEEWKNIPSLALPDGAHNYQKDTVFFLLPGRKDNLQTVYGVSCYRQMDANDLINKTADVTRSTVQKSVCVLSRLPLFGLINAKLELITHAYFDEKDFSQVALLEQTYKNLNSSMNESLLEGTQVFLGLSAKHLVTVYRHKIIMLFKLMLLERRVLMFGSPVESLCETLLGILSLMPGMLENGLGEACNQWTRKIVSPTLTIASISKDDEEEDQFLEVRYRTRGDCKSESSVEDDPVHKNNPTDVACGESNHVTFGRDETMNSDDAPESPSIPRDSLCIPYIDESGDINSNSIENSPDYTSSDKVEIKVSTDSTCDQVAQSTGKHHPYGRQRSTSSNDSDKLSVHVPNRSKDSLDTGSNSTFYDNLTLAKDESPLAHIHEITQVVAEQTGECVLDDTIPFDSVAIVSSNSSRGPDQDKISGLSLLSTRTIGEPGEEIEELDSPESIRKIDSEDCFSWEQERLQLTLHEDAESDLSLLKDVPLTSPSSEDADISRSESKDSLDVDGSGRESVSSENTLSSTSSQGAHARGKSPRSKERRAKALKNKLTSAFSKVGHKSKSKANKNDEETLEVEVLEDIQLHQDKFGHPLAVFTNGSVCHPYLSLQYHDILTDVNKRSFVIGATNILFKQRRHLVDVIVEIEDGKIDIRDKELQKQLSLTTADLRFADYLVKTVTDDKQGYYVDGTGWEGSDEWIRAQFKHYINSLLSTVLTEDARLLDDFGPAFLAAWRMTYNFRQWQSELHPDISEIPPGHPFQGNLSMGDVRVRFNQIQNTERGRKINAAVVQTGKYVVQTGKVVGGALTSAKSAVSTWFSSWRQPPKELSTEGQGEEQAVTEKQESTDSADADVSEGCGE